MSPEDIAARMDDTDFNILKSYIENPTDINTFTKVQDMFDSMGIGKMAEEDQTRFVQDTLRHYEKETTQTIKAKDLDKPSLKLAH